MGVGYGMGCGLGVGHRVGQGTSKGNVGVQLWVRLGGFECA